MRIKLAVAALAALALSGCVADPLVHGPFLIGAESPRQKVSDCRPADIRSQDARTDWYKHCADGNAPTEKLPTPAWQEGSIVGTAPSPVNRGRSAWD